MFIQGNITFLHIYDPDLVKEIITCTSSDLGIPPYFKKLLGPLLGQGILAANSSNWAHKRKVLSPMFTIDSVKVCKRESKYKLQCYHVF